MQILGFFVININSNSYGNNLALEQVISGNNYIKTFILTFSFLDVVLVLFFTISSISIGVSRVPWALCTFMCVWACVAHASTWLCECRVALTPSVLCSCT